MVIATGLGGRGRDGTTIPLAVKEGDKVLLPEFGGTNVKLEGKEYVCAWPRRHDSEMDSCSSYRNGAGGLEEDERVTVVRGRHHSCTPSLAFYPSRGGVAGRGEDDAPGCFVPSVHQLVMYYGEWLVGCLGADSPTIHRFTCKYKHTEPLMACLVVMEANGST
eukprot:scaffold175_cov414-Prasinococcus_capsulatus_cf.AAC.10